MDKVEGLFNLYFGKIKNLKYENVRAAMKSKIKWPPKLKQVFDNNGIYNTVAVDEEPYEVLRIKDIGKDKIGWKTNGQQIICGRNLIQPVEVEYVSKKDYELWYADTLNLMRIVVRQEQLKG